MPNSIQDELDMIPELQPASDQLVQHARGLFPTSSVEKKGRRWVFEPNFVTFMVQHARARTIAISLRGNPDEFNHHPDVEIKADQAGYSIFRFSDKSQLSSAKDYIGRAAEIYTRRRRR